MASRMEEFRSFVAKYPKVKEEVHSGKRTWQSIYEDWVILGEEDEQWGPFKDSVTTNSEVKKPGIDFLSSDGMKTIMGYVKKINPDSISKTLNTVQKVLQITQGFGQSGASGLYNANYNSWWD